MPTNERGEREERLRTVELMRGAHMKRRMSCIALGMLLGLAVVTAPVDADIVKVEVDVPGMY